jgi:hypothetical protein
VYEFRVRALGPDEGTARRSPSTSCASWCVGIFRRNTPHAARPGSAEAANNILNAEVRAYLASKLDASPSYRRDPLLAKEHLADESSCLRLASLHVWLDRWM